MRKNKGQSTLEYLVVLAGIIGIIMFVAAGTLKKGVTDSLTNASTAMGNIGDKID